MNRSVSKKERVNDAIDIAKHIEREDMQMKTISMILVLASKFLNNEELNEIIGGIKMTRAYELIKAEGKLEGKQLAINIIKLMSNGVDLKDIAKKLNASIEEVEEVAREFKN